MSCSNVINTQSLRASDDHEMSFKVVLMSSSYEIYQFSVINIVLHCD